MATTEQIFAISYQARELGNRVVYVLPGETKEKTLWAGLGNRSGLHSFAETLIREKWEKSGERMLKKLNKLPPGTSILVFQYRNKTRDKGSWLPNGKTVIK